MAKIIIDIEDLSRAQELFSVISQLNYVQEAVLEDDSDELQPDSINQKKQDGAISVEDLWAIASSFPKNKIWVYQDLLDNFPESLKIKVEIIQGELYIQEQSFSENYESYLQNQLIIMPGPSKLHQRISRKLSFQMSQFVEENELGEIFYAPFDVKLDDAHVLQPDIMFIAKVHYEKLKDTYYQGAPDIVVEILSPANYKAERDKKHELYEKFGVSEYWVVYPQKRKATVEVLQESRFKLFSEADKSGSVKSFILEGLEISLNDILGTPEE